MASTVILGSGIIGLSTAYYLSKHQPGSSIHLVDPSPTLFASASGFAGGFLAQEGWFQSAAASLGALSFREHARLAEKHGGGDKWGYARSVTLEYNHVGGGMSKDVAPEWLRRADGDSVRVMVENTAIVDPLLLCKFLLDECKAAGVHLYHPATALNMTTDLRDEVAGVRVGYTDSFEEVELPATRIVIAAGAWTPQVFASLFKGSSLRVPVESLAGHSLVVKGPPSEEEQRPCHAVYCALEDIAPELYHRSNGDIYLAGVNSDIPLPELATSAAPQAESIDRLLDVARRLVRTPDGAPDLTVVRRGLCFRPVTSSGLPILARVPDEQLGPGVATRPGQEGGVFLATGHGPWGISLSLGTGKVMAEMMQERRLSADVSMLGL